MIYKGQTKEFAKIVALEYGLSEEEADSDAEESIVMLYGINNKKVVQNVKKNIYKKRTYISE